MTRAEITHTSSFLIIGGSETTATLLSGMTYYLLMNPSKHKRVQDEVRRAFPQGTALTVSSTAQLKYLSAVIQETLRLYPPVPCLLPRRTNHGGTMINGTYVPGNVRGKFHCVVAFPDLVRLLSVSTIWQLITRLRILRILTNLFPSVG